MTELNTDNMTSESEINKVYVDHLESLISSGLDFDEVGLRRDWARAVEDFRQLNR